MSITPIFSIRFFQKDFFDPISAGRLGFLRFLFGIISFFYFLWWLPSCQLWLSDEGFISSNMAVGYADSAWVMSPLRLITSHTTAISVLVCGMLTSIAMAIGWYSRIATFLVTFFVIGIQYRAAGVMHGGEQLIRVVLIFLTFAETGVAFSLDSIHLRNERSEPRKSEGLIPGYPIRLIQFTVFTMYLTAVMHKMNCPTWTNGTATAFSLVTYEQRRFPVPNAFLYFPIRELMTYGTLFIQAGIFVSILVPRMRKFFFPIGVFLHLSISYAYNIPFFTMPVIACYFAFENNGLYRIERMIKSQTTKLYYFILNWTKKWRAVSQSS